MLTFINRVEITPAYHLAPNTAALSREAGFISFGGAYIPWRTLPLLGLAQLSTSCARTDGQLRETAKLTAYLSAAWRGWDDPHGAWSVRLTDADGTRYVLGVSSSDAPAISATAEMPSSPASAVRFTFSAEWGCAPLVETDIETI